MKAMSYNKLRKKYEHHYQNELLAVLGLDLFIGITALPNHTTPKRFKAYESALYQLIKELGLRSHQHLIGRGNKRAVPPPDEPVGILDKLCGIARDTTDRPRSEAALSLAALLVWCRVDRKLLEEKA
jgi:hypothetical protein